MWRFRLLVGSDTLVRTNRGGRDVHGPPRRSPPAATGPAARARCGTGEAEGVPRPRGHGEVPGNSVWEGSGNVVSVDGARAAGGEPDADAALLAGLASVRGANASFDRHCEALEQLLRDADDDRADGRRLAQAVALAVSGAELIRHAPEFVADAYCASRLAPTTYAGAAFGSLPSAVATNRIVERALAN